MPTKGHPLQRRLAKQMRHLKKWLFKLRPSKLVTVLLLLLIWLYRERQESDEQLDELLEANPESKLAYYVRLVRNKLINFLLFIVVPCLVIVYNLSDGDLMRKIGRFGQESSLVQLFCSIFGFFTGRADEVDELDEQDKARLYQKYDVTIEKLPLELENLRLELKKELKQMKRAVETLAKDHQQFRTVANRFRSGNDTKLETFENKLLEIINEELGRVKDSLLDRINHFQQKYSFLDPSNYEKFCEMFETADAAADLIRKRDHQLKDLFKATTEIILKSELTDEELKEVKRAYLDLVEEIKSNNQDLTKYVEHVKQISDDHLTNKFKSDQIKLFNVSRNRERHRSEIAFRV